MMQEATTDLFLQPEEHDTAGGVERVLLLLSGLFLAVNFGALMIVRASTQFTDWMPLLVWIGCALGGHLFLRRTLPHRDPLLFPLVMFLSGWGIILIDRLAPIFADRQAIWLIVSVCAMALSTTWSHTLRLLKEYRYLLLLFGLVLLVSTIILGRNPSGQADAPQLWLGFEGIFFQPSELLKVILVAFLSSYLAEQYPTLRAEHLGVTHRLSFSPRILGPMMLMWGLSVVILIWQRDLGTAVLFFVVFLLLVYVASGFTPILFAGAVLVVIAAFVAYHLFSVVELRIDIWWNPWPEADNRAYQIVQSLMAFAAGGVFGQGIGQGIPTFIPVVHSDFVFAAIAEEWGLLGVMTVIVCIAMLIARGFRVATLQNERPFYALLAVGLSLLIATQSLLIMGGVLKLVPLTGVTLPYLSYGGSSLLMSFVIIGLLLRLSAEENS